MSDRIATLVAITSSVVLLVAGTVGPRTVDAQAALAPEAAAPTIAPAPRRWEFVISSGRFMPVGGQRDLVAGAAQTSATLTRLLTPAVALTASVGWARSRELISLDEQRLDVLTYDIGAELRAMPRPLGARVTLRPIVGAGVGLRSYDPRGTSGDVTRGAAAYLAMGAEAGVRRLRARVELRDYLADAGVLRGLGGTHSDLSVLLGLRLERR